MPVSNIKQRLTGRLKNPLKVVNICFIVVFIFSTLLTWREAIVLEKAYISGQRSELSSVASNLDLRLQHSVDNLLFYRNTMRYALQSPISTDKSRRALGDFDQQRSQPAWQLRLDHVRSIPVNGVSDRIVSRYGFLNRDPQFIYDELGAALELSYILQLSDYSRDIQLRTFYVSRAGFYITSTPENDNRRVVEHYERLISQPWFLANSERYNRDRGLRWSQSNDVGLGNVQQNMTVSVPLDYELHWYGVLGMDFSPHSMHTFLVDAIKNANSGTIQLYDNKFNKIASSLDEPADKGLFTERQKAEITQSMLSGAQAGEVRFDSRFVTWIKLKSVDGTLIKVHTLQEGLRGEFGVISIVLILLWLLFVGMLLGSWMVVRRLVSNLLNLQNTLSWRANYDALTRILNRGAFFEQAQTLAETGKVSGAVFSVIQLDLDHFKSVNDRFGHSAGDKVLAHASSMLTASLRGNDIAGRVGGEEFCVALPGATLADANRIAERIRQRIRSKEILVDKNQTIRITASFGVSSSQEKGIYDFAQLQSIADARLYKAKQNGRNRVWSSD